MHGQDSVRDSFSGVPARMGSTSLRPMVDLHGNPLRLWRGLWPTLQTALPVSRGATITWSRSPVNPSVGWGRSAGKGQLWCLGRAGFEMHTHHGSSQPLLAMGPLRSVPPWWHLASGCLVLLQPLYPHQIKVEHMHSAWSKPSRVVGQWQEGRRNRRVGIPCHGQPRTPRQHHPARL